MLAALSYSPLDSPKSIQKLKVPDSDTKRHKVSNKMKRVSITMKLTYIHYIYTYIYIYTHYIYSYIYIYTLYIYINRYGTISGDLSSCDGEFQQGIHLARWLQIHRPVPAQQELQFFDGGPRWKDMS